MRRNGRILWATAPLAALGLAITAYCTIFGYELPYEPAYLPVVPLFGLLFAEASLVGIGLVYGPGAFWKRLAAGLVALAILEVSLQCAMRSNVPGDFLGTPTIAAGATLGALLAARGLGWRAAVDDGRPSGPGLRVSIGSLMAITMVVALLFGGAKALHAWELGDGVPDWVIYPLWSLCFAACGLAAFATALGRERPGLRAGATLAASAMLGPLFIYAVAPGEPDLFGYFAAMMALHAASVLGVMLAARSCGYRLVRYKAADTPTPHRVASVTIGRTCGTSMEQPES